jgi:hypothetical protein
METSVALVAAPVRAQVQVGGNGENVGMKPILPVSSVLQTLCVASALFLSFVTPATLHAAPDYWRVFVIRNATNQVFGFVDVETFRLDGPYKDFWMTSVVFPGDTRYAQGIRYFMTENHANCAGRSHRAGLEFIHYADGHMTPSPGWGPWSVAATGTLGAALVDFACASPSRRSSFGVHMASRDIRKLLVEVGAPQ